MEKKICLSIEQMQKLKELGVETEYGSLCWVKSPDSDYWLTVHDENCYEMGFLRPIPTLTLQDMLEMMPIYIENGLYSLELSFDEIAFTDKPVYTLQYLDLVRNESKHSIEKENLIDITFDMLIWLAKNGYLKKKA